MNPKKIIIGSETEYGIFVLLHPNQFYPFDFANKIAIDAMIDEAIIHLETLFRGLRGGIAHAEEHRALDFDAREEVVSPEDLQAHRGLAQRCGFTGVMLPNGSRFYEDMGHPEYSCPEVTDPFEAVLAQKAGDRLVSWCRARIEEKALDFFDTWLIRDEKPVIRVDKRNSDGRGHSYAAHENYSLSPRLFGDIVIHPFFYPEEKRFSRSRYIGGRQSFVSENKKINTLLALLIARSIITGSGKVGSDIPESVIPYQISQRAEFIECLANHDTTVHRGLINSRDRPYANREQFRRLHVIAGDGNLSEISLFLKYGITALVLMMLEDDYFSSRATYLGTSIYEPVETSLAVAQDLSLRAKLCFHGKGEYTALEVMKEILSFARQYVVETNMGGSWQEVVHICERVLSGLAGNRLEDEWASSLDWVAKEKILLAYAKKHGVPLNDMACKTIDHQYHDMNESQSLFKLLERRGKIKRIADETQIDRFVTTPPTDTRAFLRGELVRRFGPRITFMRWNEIVFFDRHLYISDPFFGNKQDTERLLQGNPSLEEFMRRVASEDSAKISIERRAFRHFVEEDE